MRMLVVTLKSIVILVSVLLSVAFMTVGERKYLSSIQRRRGPNIVGYYGLLQAFSDGLKLLLKETTRPTSADRLVYLMSPVLSFSVSLVCWGLLPVGEGVVLVDLDVGVFMILAVSSIGVYGVLLGGYSSNSKYGYYGGVRSSAQMISYEVSIGFTVSVVILYSGGTLNLTNIVLSQTGLWHVVGLLPVFVLFVVAILAETNRHPFDLPEAESELVSGYNVEYSSGSFALFFLGEYSSIILMSGLCVTLFLGGFIGGIMLFSLKVFFLICVFIWCRAAYPRYRYDQLIFLGWSSLLPMSLGWLFMCSGLIYVF